MDAKMGPDRVTFDRLARTIDAYRVQGMAKLRPSDTTCGQNGTRWDPVGIFWTILIAVDWRWTGTGTMAGLAARSRGGWGEVLN